MITKRITFTGSAGNELSAKLDLPDTAPKSLRHLCTLLHLLQRHQRHHQNCQGIGWSINSSITL